MSAARSCPVCDGRVRACLSASPSWGLREVWFSMAALILLLLKHYDPLKENRKVLSLSEYKLQKSRSFPILNTPHLIHSNLLCKKGSHVKPSIYTFFSHHLHFFRTKPSQRIKCYFAMGIKKKPKQNPHWKEPNAETSLEVSYATQGLHTVLLLLYDLDLILEGQSLGAWQAGKTHLASLGSGLWASAGGLGVQWNWKDGGRSGICVSPTSTVTWGTLLWAFISSLK